MTVRVSTRKNTFGAFILQRREVLGLSQGELASRVGIARSTMCDMEKGRRLPSLRGANAWAMAFELPHETVVGLILQQRVMEAGLRLIVKVTQP